MKKGEAIIGIDLGGTKLASGCISDSKIISKSEVTVPSLADKATIIELIKSEIKSLLTTNTTGVGIGVPSVVDTIKGIVYDVQNIPSWDHVPLKDVLEYEFGIPVKINNDANCFALAEKYYGEAKGSDNVVGLVCGTGMAVGLISEGHLVEGPNCGVGEIGMIPYNGENYEYYCSGQYFSNEFKMRGEQVFDLAKKGNQQALMIFDYFGNHFGNALLTAAYAYDPEVIAIGGSVSKSREFYESIAFSKFNEMVYQNSKSRLKVYFSELEDAGIYGAASLFR